jgi:protein TonB
MFERAVILNARGGTQRRAALFPVSVALHGLVVTGFIVSAVWSVNFPKDAPAQFQPLIFQVTPKIPDPVEPKPIRIEKPATTQQQQPQNIFAAPHQQVRSIVTPNEIPNTIPEVTATSGIGEVVQAVPTNIGGPIGEITTGPSGDDEHPIQTAGNTQVTPPTVTLRVEPVFPTALIGARLSGTAVVECTVGRDGTVQEVRPIQASHALFEASAVQAVRQWKFRPGLLNGRPVATIFTLVVRFEVKRQ